MKGPLNPQQAAERMNHGYLTPLDAERRFGIKPNTLRTWARRGHINALRFARGQRILLNYAEVLALVCLRMPELLPQQPEEQNESPKAA
jgi:hypothetical protein